MKLIQSMALTMAALTAVATHADTVKIKVDGMVCAFCAGAIEKKMKSNAETASVFVSLENKLVAVEEKPGLKLVDAKLKAQIADAGYEVKGIERVSETVNQVREQIKAKKS